MLFKRASKQNYIYKLSRDGKTLSPLIKKRAINALF